jgi:hypothetical protein
MAIWTFGKQMYLAIVSYILYMNRVYFKFDRIRI